MRDYPTFDILYFKTMYVYCVHSAMLCIHKILKFTNKKAKNILLEFPFRCLQQVPCLSSGYCAPLYIRHRVPGDFIHLVDV